MAFAGQLRRAGGAAHPAGTPQAGARASAPLRCAPRARRSAPRAPRAAPNADRQAASPGPNPWPQATPLQLQQLQIPGSAGGSTFSSYSSFEDAAVELAPEAELTIEQEAARLAALLGELRACGGLEERVSALARRARPQRSSSAAAAGGACARRIDA